MFDRKIITGMAALGLSLGLVAAPATAATHTISNDFGTWDANGDAGIDNQEFCTGFQNAGIYENWDTDADGALSQTEYDAGLGENDAAFEERFGADVFNTWDADNSGALSEQEYCNAAYAGYDADESNVIEEPEFGDVGDDMGDEGFWDV